MSDEKNIENIDEIKENTELKNTVEKKTVEAIAKEEIAPAQFEEEEKEEILKFRKPYVFEGQEYTEIDLSGIADLTIQDAINVQKSIEPTLQVSAATATIFASMIAQKVTGYPAEFFKLMPKGAAIDLRNTVLTSMVKKTESEDHILKFNKPYTFEGQEYTEVDLNGLSKINGMLQCEAESKLARAGYSLLQPDQLYEYMCIIAGMATGLPEKFFKNLPITELINLKNEVENEDFLE